MSKITLPQIQETLEPEGWQVVSTEYKNLSTEMSFLCPEGHSVYATWSKLRTKRECPICASNSFKFSSQTIIEKKPGIKRILALDQATNRTGWAVFDNKQLVQYGVYEASGSLEEQHIHSVKMWLVSMIENWKPDVIGIEGIQYQQNFGVTTFQTLARLQGVLIELCVESKLNHKICPTNTWRAHCGVKGKTRSDKKASMIQLVKHWFDVTISDDEADAIGIGKYLADTYSSSMETVNWE